MTAAMEWTAQQAVTPLVQSPLRRYRAGSLLAKIIAALDDVGGMACRTSDLCPSSSRGTKPLYLPTRIYSDFIRFAHSRRWTGQND